MNRILRTDLIEQIAVVEPGVLNAERKAAAAEHGLFHAPGPATTAICFIGASIATNAGGMRCAKCRRGLPRLAASHQAISLPLPRAEHPAGPALRAAST